jgi:RNAse (barnase) inhibitor barstar
VPVRREDRGAPQRQFLRLACWLVKTFEIDGRAFATLEEFYDEISRVVIPGAAWGRNLDAFNDILKGGFGTPEGGFTLLWKHHAVSRERLGYEETARQLELRLERCHPSNRDRVRAELDAARSATGETVFDWLVEIIRAHGPVGAEAEDGVELVLD